MKINKTIYLYNFKYIDMLIYDRYVDTLLLDLKANNNTLIP